jgi:hypothetical protein
MHARVRICILTSQTLTHNNTRNNEKKKERIFVTIAQTTPSTIKSPNYTQFNIFSGYPTQHQMPQHQLIQKQTGKRKPKLTGTCSGKERNKKFQTREEIYKQILNGSIRSLQFSPNFIQILF